MTVRLALRRRSPWRSHPPTAPSVTATSPVRGHGSRRGHADLACGRMERRRVARRDGTTTDSATEARHTSPPTGRPTPPARGGDTVRAGRPLRSRLPSRCPTTPFGRGRTTASSATTQRQRPVSHDTVDAAPPRLLGRVDTRQSDSRRSGDRRPVGWDGTERTVTTDDTVTRPGHTHPSLPLRHHPSRSTSPVVDPSFLT